jgi:response regulator of citrate/malate metabolism
VNPIRTLIVDDDFRVAGIHAAYVERIPGFTVVATVHTAAAARDAARKHRPDLVLLDVYLPDQPGLDLYRSLPPCDLVLVTAAQDTATIAAAIRAGALHYIVKPFQLRTLEAKLTAYRRMREMLGSRQELDQVGVDRVYQQLRAGDASDAQLPKGQSPTTTLAVARALEASGTELSAAQVATATGVSRATAQRHLSALADAGKVELVPRYGVPGPSTATAASFENTVTIRRPIAAVFAFLADFENIPAWNYAIVETRKVSPGPVAANLGTLRQILERDNQRGSG